MKVQVQVTRQELAELDVTKVELFEAIQNNLRSIDLLNDAGSLYFDLDSMDVTVTVVN